MRALIHVTMLHNLSKSFHFGMCLHDFVLHNYIAVGVRENQAHKRMLQHTTLILKQCVNMQLQSHIYTGGSYGGPRRNRTNKQI